MISFTRFIAVPRFECSYFVLNHFEGCRKIQIGDFLSGEGGGGGAVIANLSFLALIGVAIASGYGGIAWWWMLIPAVLTAVGNIASGPSYERVMAANREGRLSVFPITLAVYTLLTLPVGFFVR